MNKDLDFADNVNMAVKILKKGGVILYPTDTIWGLGCDATNTKAVKRIFNIKKREATKSMIVLVEDEQRLRNHVGTVPETIYDLISSIQKPLSVIFPDAHKLAANAIAADGSIAIRITSHPLCREIIKRLNKPIISTSANISGKEPPMTFQDIDTTIKESVDFIVPMKFESINEAKASTIIQLRDDGSFIILRD